MSTLKDIRKCILDMEPDDALALILRIRESRQTPKVSSRVAKSKPAQKVTKINKAIDNMSQLELEELIKELEGKL